LSVIDSLYFTVITLTAVGYGDITLDGNSNHIFLTFYVLIGVFLVGSLLATLLENIMVKHEESLKDNFSEAGVEINLLLRNIRKHIYLDKAFDMSSVPFKTFMRVGDIMVRYISRKGKGTKDNNNKDLKVKDNTRNRGNSMYIKTKEDTEIIKANFYNKIEDNLSNKIENNLSNKIEDNFSDKLINVSLDDSSVDDVKKVGIAKSFLSKRIRQRVNKKRAIKESIIRIHDSTMDVYDKKLHELIYKSIFNLIIVFTFICVGSIALSYVENWHITTAVYFTSVTITTVGYGGKLIRIYNSIIFIL
jgi:hypothetical protein